MSRPIKTVILMILAAAVLAAVIAWGVGWRQTADALAHVGLPAFLAVGVGLFAVMAFQAAAWLVLERGIGHRVRYRTLLSASVVAMAGNILTPASHLGGEPVKIIYAGRKTGLGYTELAGTVLLCKYIEAMSFAVFIGFSAAVSLVEFRSRLLRPPNELLGAGIVAVAALALVLGAVLWIALSRTWTPLSALVALAARLRIRPAWFDKLRNRTLRMEAQASQMFRREGRAVVWAFFFYLLTHVAMFARPLAFFLLGWQVRLSMAELGLLFLSSQVLLAVQLLPSGAGTLDGGLLKIVAVAGMAISAPQCAAFLLCMRFWDAAVVGGGALLAARAGVGLFRQKDKPAEP